MHSMKVIVLGTGAIGTYYGGQLARAGHAVTCFARGANLAAIQECGLEIRTPEGALSGTRVGDGSFRLARPRRFRDPRRQELLARGHRADRAALRRAGNDGGAIAEWR